MQAGLASCLRAAGLAALASWLSAAPAQGQGGPFSLSGGVTTIGQWADDARVRSEIVGSLDLFAELSLGRALLHVYGEVNTTPFTDGVSRLIGEANTDAGTALNRRRRGRGQISEVRLALPLGSSRLHAGLLDATGFLDVSRIANDENLFFLGVPFVNNPTIEFPDYSLGGAVEGPLGGDGALNYALVVSSSHGLADNPNVSYAQLLDVGEEAKGLFAGATARWTGRGRRFAVGGWVNSAEHTRLDDDPRTAASRGLFSVLGWSRGAHALSARAGVANGEVSLIDRFLGLTYLWSRRPDAVGLAVGKSHATRALDGLDDVLHAEAFIRRRLLREVFVTGSVQRIHNTGFDPSRREIADRLWVLGVRLSAQF